MIRQIIEIDEEKCNGCGLCANACHEGAIGIIDGKAKLLRDDYCDGMGDCLPACPAGAISFTQREADAYDEKAVEENKRQKAARSGGCPGSRVQIMTPQAASFPAGPAVSQLRNWPVQIKLAPLSAPYFDGANLLIAADCSAYAYADFHRRFLQGKTALIGCPKLDGEDYSRKLTAILRDNDIQSVTVVRMQVPCCGGLENAAMKAILSSGKSLPWQVVTLTSDGKILNERRQAE